MWFHFHQNTLVFTVLVIIVHEQVIGTEFCTESCEMERGSSNALVLYDENKLSPLVKPSRSFHFVNTDLVIEQEWGNLGVAGVVWDAALVLCEYLEKVKDDLIGREVIELGAGSGIVGIVAALLGANVVITDRETVFPYLRKVVRNNLKDKDNIKYSVRVLDWTKDLNKFQQKYDVILGADIIYVEEVFDSLLETLLHMSDKDTKVYISCKIRYDRDTNFLDMLSKHFTLQEIFYENERDIKIYLCRKLK